MLLAWMYLEGSRIKSLLRHFLNAQYLDAKIWSFALSRISTFAPNTRRPLGGIGAAQAARLSLVTLRDVTRFSIVTCRVLETFNTIARY